MPEVRERMASSLPLTSAYYTNGAASVRERWGTDRGRSEAHRRTERCQV
jgi:hypothetical protein